MACQLYTENDISALYTIVRGEIMDRIQDPKLGKFDDKALNNFIKEVYEEFKDEPNGILYVQAIPDMLDIVKNDLEIKKYLRQEAGLSFDYVQDLSLDFENLDNVMKFVTPPVKNPTEKQVKKKIKQGNKTSKNVVQNNNNTKTPWSSVQEKAKVDYPDKTTGQIAIAKNPETMTAEERNAKDPQKKLFDQVIKTVIWLTRRREANDVVMLGDTPIMLKAQSIRNLSSDDLTDYDKSFLSKNKTYNVNVAIISDTKGNPIRFDEEGNVVETGGRIVYQYIRPVINVNNKLYLGNRAGYIYSLIPAEELAKKEIALETAEGNLVGQTERDAKYNTIKEKQTQKMNSLAKLNSFLEISDEYTLLPITGGSYGIVETKTELLSNTDFADDLEMIYIHDSGDLEGNSYFISNKVSAGVAVDNRIYLQKMDMTEAIAKNIAKVLTTNALLDGEPLSPQAKLEYYETFLSNRVVNNNIKVEIDTVLGLNKLMVTIIDPLTKKATLLDLESKTAEKEITDHLLAANKFVKRDGTIQSYPASMSYMKRFAIDGAIQKGERFSDYEFTTTKNGTSAVREVKKDYFEFIKPMMKVDYTVDSGAYFVGINSYLSFDFPFEFTGKEDLIDIGLPNDESIVSNDIDNGDKKPKAPVSKSTTTDKEKETEFKINAKVSSLSNEKTLIANMNQADIVFGLGVNFTNKDEKVVEQRAAKENKWYGVKLGSKSSAPKTFKPSQDAIDQMVKNLANIKGNVLNIVGNDIAELAKEGYTQNDIDKYVYNILSEVVKQYPISEIVSNGQTGIAEASIKAAKKLNIPVTIRAFTGYQLRSSAPYLATGYKSTKNTRADFLGRFYSKSSKTFQKQATRRTKPEDDSTTIPEKVVIPEKTVEEQKVADKKINTLAIDDLLDGYDFIPGLPRSKRKSAIMNQLYGSKSAWNEVQTWWENSPLKNLVELERLATVYNSTAYGTFLSAGSLLADVSNKLRKEGFAARIELYGDATPITLYHEAWHAFSQLVLTIEEKTKLYDEIRKNPQWANKEYIDIEEDLAENFIEYAVTGKKQEGFIQTIFNKIKSIIDYFFGKTSHRDVTRLYDIPVVKEYYDKLYTGNFKIDTENAENNLMPGFEKLNSAKKMIQPLENTTKDFAVITDTQSNKIVDLLDSLMARTFYQYNSRYNTTSGAVRLLTDITNRQNLYSNIEKQLKVLLNNQTDIVQKITLENVQSENPDYVKEQKEMDKLMLLTKAVDNYGVVGEALAKKTDKGVVAFHMQRSRFSILKDAYRDDIEDPTTGLFSTIEGNAISAKQLATDDTMMMLSGIYMLQRDSKGEYLTREDENGVSTYLIDTDDFGLPKLEPVNDMWNKLARTLQGSLDFQEMYDRLSKSIDNNPEFIQVLQILPNPYQMGPAAYNNKTEFKSETNFWQDLKKPVIPYIQLNINKTVIEKATYVDGKKIPEKSKYESRLAAANFDVYRIINDWTTNFNIADTATNKYIIKDKKYGTTMLNTALLMKDFSINKQLDPAKAADFLAALGIQLDMRSAEIRNIVKNKDKPFSSQYNIDFIYNNMRLVHLAGKSDDLALKNASDLVKKQPLYYLMNDLPDAIVKAAGGKSRDVKTKISTLAQLQNRFSDGYSNYSVLTPEKNKVWEQFLDNSVTRIVTSINRAKNWQQLTMDEADPNGRFQHMRWMGEKNNPSSQFSVILNSIFDSDPMSSTYGEKLPGAELLLENIGGTQIINREANESTGTSTAATDVTSKFLQELHTMLQSGVQEFMRHASKQTAMNLRAKKVSTYGGKKASNLYVDVMAFSPTNTAANNNLGESQAFNIMLGYIAAEAGRIYRFKSNKEYFGKFSSYNRNVVRKDNGETVKAGEAFTAFDDVLSPEIQGDLYTLIDAAIEDANIEQLQSGYFNVEDFNLKDMINENPDLRKKVKEDVIKYFNKQSQKNYNRLEEARYIDQSLYDMVASDEFSKDQVDKMLVKAYTYNSWIHNFETTIMVYGDLVQYNHDKEEFHKRNAGVGSGGRSFRADFRARMYINSPMFQRLYAEKEGYKLEPYTGKLNTAIIKEEVIKESVYNKEYYDNHVKEYTQRYIKAGKSKTEAARLAKELATIVLKDYNDMKLADGQGWINFEAYRMLKDLEGNWTSEQEALYKRIVNKETITASEIAEFFPPYKLQYYGNIKVNGLPLTSFHKFSLAPIIPTVHTPNTKLGQIHDMMLKQNIDYVLMETGEKVGHFGDGDVITDANGNINPSAVFTKNVIYAEYLKNQTEVNNTYKEKSIFSTQMRKMILEGLYEKGEIDSNDPNVTTLVNNYVDRVSKYTNLLKNELIDELGFEETADGEYIPVDKDSLAKLTKMIRANLERDDVYSDDLIDIIDVTEEGDLRFDLSLHPEAAKIEKLLLSLINKKIIKQKVKGEPLVQKSSAFYDGLVELNLDTSKMNAKAKDAAIKKYMGSNFLPTYHKGTDGKTTAMKVAISLQGDYENLLNLEYKGEPISTIDRLNEAIKDDEWLDANNKANRKAITMVGVRIPVQGLNSMEFMEVYHFLPPQAGNIIIPPAEIVAKSGADFDIDKLSIFMNNIDPEGNIKVPMFENDQEFYDAIKDPSKFDMTKKQMYNMQKAGIENQLINDMRSILELPQNYVSLTTPNGTYLVKDIADELAQYVMEYNPYENMMTNEPNKSAKDKNGKQKEVISPTRVLEVGYNLYKHESNVVGKKTLGLGAIENTFNVIFNSLGASMPAVYKHGTEEIERTSFLGLRHNKMIKNGEEVISLSNQYDVDGNNKVADIISQLINGWVDVEKDAWVFFVQGNYEVAPILLYLLKTGVPVKEAVYFVSQPLVRDYVKERRLAESTFAEPLRKSVGNSGVTFKAASNVIAKNFKKFIADNQARYQVGEKMLDQYFTTKKREGDDRHFTEEEMLQLIKDSKTNPDAAKSELSRTMFLHYLTIEQQIQGITELKIAANPDTALNTDVGQAIQAESTMDKLAEESKIDQDLRLGLLNDSIISSFFNTKLITGLAKPLFKFRYNEDIQDYIENYMSSFVNAPILKASFGRNYREKFPVTFRNDLLSYLFQNALRKYNIQNQYSSYALSEAMSLAPAAGLKFGAQVVEDKNGPTLLLDRVQIEKEFFDKSYLEGSDAQNSYEDRGLYPLQPGHFGSNTGSNKDEYIRFVLEREFLRHLMPVREVIKTKEFKKELENTNSTRITNDETKNRRYTYEKIIAMKALDNVLNPYHLFNDRNNAYGVRLERLKIEYKNDFVGDYPVLSRMIVDSNNTETMFNLYVDDKDMNTFKSNLYTRNLQDLSDRTIVKVEDKAENDRISDFFAKITYVAMMQAGTNKSKYNFLSLTDYDKFIDIMNDETAKFLESPIKTKLLVDFKNKFEQANSQTNRDRYRFKNYLTGINVEKAIAAQDIIAGMEEDVITGEMIDSAESMVERKNLIETINPNVFVYNDLSGTEKAYKYIVDNNPDITFVYKFSLGQKQNFATLTPEQFNKKQLKGQVQLKKIANSSSIGLITGLTNVSDNFDKTELKYYKNIKAEIEKAIAEINTVIENGGKVAFSINGYGDPTLMPEELFVYLSRRLFEEFQYLNPGSEFVQEVSSEVAKYQPITDAEILAKFEGENNPLNCI